MKYLSSAFLLLTVILSVYCNSNEKYNNNHTTIKKNPIVKSGLEVLAESKFAILKGKRIGLATNPTAITSKFESSIDVIFKSKDCKLTTLFAPEHGVRGDYYAGDNIDNSADPFTNLPIYSLHGKTRKPSPEMLKNIDVFVYDMQDIGSRSYTYISTMGLCMEACAENNIEFVVLDRPNPLGGNKIEGNITDTANISFVSQFQIPYIYGLTCGELANFLNEEKMLKKGIKCKLTVVPMENWKRNMTFNETGLPWVLTSPNIPYSTTPMYYVATGIMGELGYYSEGVGYTLPFQLLGGDWINPKLMSDKLNSMNIEGACFRPITYNVLFGKNKDKKMGGVQVYINDYNKVNLMSIQFLFMQANNELYPKKNPFKDSTSKRFRMFDNVCGSKQIRILFTKRFMYEDIKNFLNKDIEGFRNKSKKYYLYQ